MSQAAVTEEASGAAPGSTLHTLAARHGAVVALAVAALGLDNAASAVEPGSVVSEASGTAGVILAGVAALKALQEAARWALREYDRRRARARAAADIAADNARFTRECETHPECVAARRRHATRED